MMNPGKEPFHKPPECTCQWGIGAAVVLHGVNMGKEWVRITTDPECPEHQPEVTQ